MSAHFTSKDDDSVPPCKTRHLAPLHVYLISDTSFSGIPMRLNATHMCILGRRYQMLFQSQQIPDEGMFFFL